MSRLPNPNKEKNQEPDSPPPQGGNQKIKTQTSDNTSPLNHTQKGPPIKKNNTPIPKKNKPPTHPYTHTTPPPQPPPFKKNKTKKLINNN